MKSNFKTITLATAAIAVTAIFSCKKETTPTPTSTTTTTSNPTTLAAFYTTNGVKTQSFVVNNTTGATITGANGGKYFFPKNFFMNEANQVVTGNVNIQLKEIFTPANMLLSNMPTMAGKRGLISEGEFFVGATQNNQALKPNGNFNAHLPLVDTNKNNGLDTVLVWSYNNNSWSDNYGCGATYLSDSISVTSDSLNWINADAYYSGPTYQLLVDVPNTPNISQTAIFIYVNGHKAIWQGSLISGTQFLGSIDIPAGDLVTVIGLCTTSNGTLYSFFYPYTNPGKNDEITCTFTSTTISAFTTQLSSLK